MGCTERLLYSQLFIVTPAQEISQARSPCETNPGFHLSKVAVTAQDTNGGIVGAVRGCSGAADVVPNWNEGVSGD